MCVAVRLGAADAVERGRMLASRAECGTWPEVRNRLALGFDTCQPGIAQSVTKAPARRVVRLTLRASQSSALRCLLETMEYIETAPPAAGESAEDVWARRPTTRVALDSDLHKSAQLWAAVPQLNWHRDPVSANWCITRQDMVEIFGDLAVIPEDYDAQGPANGFHWWSYTLDPNTLFSRIWETMLEVLTASDWEPTSPSGFATRLIKAKSKL